MRAWPTDDLLVEGVRQWQPCGRGTDAAYHARSSAAGNVQGGDADSGRVLCRVRGPDAGRGGGVQVAGSAEQWFMVLEVLSFSN